MGKIIKFGTLNVKGLGSVVKRKRIELLLKKSKFDIIFLQETHQTKDGFNELKILNVDIYEKSFGSSNARGVAILISKNCECLVNNMVKDKEGRYIILQVTMGKEEYTLVNVYAPNINQNFFYNHLWDQIELVKRGYVIMAGDFNMVLDKIKDKTTVKKEDWRNRQTFLAKFVNSIGMKDVWRELKGDEKKFTFYSSVHKSYSRIDYIFVSQSLISKIDNIEIGMIRVSDHATVSIDLQVEKNYKEAKRWRMNSKIFQYPEALERIKKEWLEIWDINEKAGSSIGVLWDTLKAVTRGLLTRENSILNKTKNLIKSNLEKTIAELEASFIVNNDRKILLQIEAKKKELEDIDLQEVQRNLLYLKRDFFEYNNRNSRLLARMAQKRKQKNTIGKIKDSSGQLCTHMPAKLKAIQEFYQALYTAKSTRDEVIDEYITKNLKVTLNEDDIQVMDKPISEQEIETVIDHLKVNKTPGADGLGSEYYKVFKPMLIPKLKKLYNQIMEGELAPKSWNFSLIILIPKPNKNLSEIGSYRPISLLNQDAKIFTAILARRMNNFICNYIKGDQCGFIKGRQMSNIVRRTLNVLHVVEKTEDKVGIMSLDLFKAFDCVQWSTLKILLGKWGFSKKFLGVINQLYSEATASIIVNDGLTGQVTLGRGTRQGCPLSPVLFCIVIELLANAIRSDNSIKGVGKEGEIKISLFADDALLTIYDPVNSMSRIKKHLDDFGETTGLRVNWQKSEAMLFNHDSQESKIISNFGLKSLQSITYLGIQLYKNIFKTKDFNFHKTREEIKLKLQEYSNLKLSWFGRIALVKMKILPKINFLFKMLPVQYSDKELKSLQEMINRYCNGDKKARISKSLWFKSQKEGGLGIPNIKNYYIANQFSCLGEILFRADNLIWWEMESTELKRGINEFLFGNTRIRLEFKNPFLTNILGLWNKLRSELSPKGSPLCLITDLEDFPLNLKIYAKLFKERKVARLEEWMVKMKSKKEMKDILLCNKLTWLNYTQLERWTKEWARRNGQLRQYTKFEQFLLLFKCDKEIVVKGSVGKIYKILDELRGSSEQDVLREIWEQDFGKKINKEDWKKIWKMRILRSLSVRIKENYFKLALRWYLTPLRLNRIKPEYPKTCWKCEKEIGSYIHLWWDCEIVQKFWKLIFAEVKEMLQVDIECKPDIALLSLLNRSVYDVKMSEAIANFMTAARLIIAKNWKSKLDFRIEDWYQELWDIALNDKLSCSLKVRRGEMKKDIFYDIWGKFIDYVLGEGKGKKPKNNQIQFWTKGL